MHSPNGRNGEDAVLIQERSGGDLKICVFDGNNRDGLQVALAGAKASETTDLDARSPQGFLGAFTKKLPKKAHGGTMMTQALLSARKEEVPIVTTGDCPVYLREDDSLVSPGIRYTYIEADRRVVRTETLSFEEYAQNRHAPTGGIYTADGTSVHLVSNLTRPGFEIDSFNLVLASGQLMVLASDGLPKMLGVGVDAKGNVSDALGCADLARILHGVCDPEEAINILVAQYNRRYWWDSRALPTGEMVEFALDDVAIVVVGRQG